ncbi:MAG TPA: nucleotidyltransferase domain-containing protein [Humisphaera sp.]|nr:nucleotidyltransferase domain-containing protein [Humisphaera sp.]
MARQVSIQGISIILDVSYHTMIPARDIEVLADEIVRKFSPQRIDLFGSYASGAPTEDSDVDLLVVMAHKGPGYEGACRVRLAVDADFPLDVLVSSPARLKRRLAMGDSFLCDIVERGLVLHDSNDRRVGEQRPKAITTPSASSDSQLMSERQRFFCHKS